MCQKCCKPSYLQFGLETEDTSVTVTGKDQLFLHCTLKELCATLTFITKLNKYYCHKLTIKERGMLRKFMPMPN